MTVDLHRRTTLHGLGALAWLGLAACASTPSPDLVRAFAPTGRLRACINLGNPILANRVAGAEGGVAGVSVDLARALAALLGVPAVLDVVESAGRSVERVRGVEDFVDRAQYERLKASSESARQARTAAQAEPAASAAAAASRRRRSAISGR